MSLRVSICASFLRALGRDADAGEACASQRQYRTHSRHAPCTSTQAQRLGVRSSTPSRLQHTTRALCAEAEARDSARRHARVSKKASWHYRRGTGTVTILHIVQLYAGRIIDLPFCRTKYTTAAPVIGDHAYIPIAPQRPALSLLCRSPVQVSVQAVCTWKLSV